MEMSIFDTVRRSSFVLLLQPIRPDHYELALPLQLFIFIFHFGRIRRSESALVSLKRDPSGVRFVVVVKGQIRWLWRAMMIIKINCSQITRSNSVRFIVELSRSSHFLLVPFVSFRRSDLSDLVSLRLFTEPYQLILESITRL